VTRKQIGKEPDSVQAIGLASRQQGLDKRARSRRAKPIGQDTVPVTRCSIVRSARRHHLVRERQERIDQGSDGTGPYDAGRDMRKRGCRVEIGRHGRDRAIVHGRGDGEHLASVKWQIAARLKPA
jgi:hypothetical protein